jgi:hypothetical protein
MTHREVAELARVWTNCGKHGQSLDAAADPNSGEFGYDRIFEKIGSPAMLIGSIAVWYKNWVVC